MNKVERVLTTENVLSDPEKFDLGSENEDTDESISEGSPEKTNIEITKDDTSDERRKRTHEIKNERVNPQSNDLKKERPKRIYIKIENDTKESISEISQRSRKRNLLKIESETREPNIDISERSKSKRTYIEIKNETEEHNDDSSERRRPKGNYISVQNEGLSEESQHEPNFVGYQLVGDSQFCRFGQQILGLERVPTPNGNGRIGICVSGQTISELHQRVREKFYPLGDKIVLMIGTNDFLKNAEVSTMCQQLSALVNTLKKQTTCIILLTLPPVPKLAHKPEHWRRLEIYNEHIHSLCNEETIKLGDISHMYQHPKMNKCLMYLFETYFSGGQNRLDMIHLNKKGLEIIRNHILDNF